MFFVCVLEAFAEEELELSLFFSEINPVGALLDCLFESSTISFVSDLNFSGFFPETGRTVFTCPVADCLLFIFEEPEFVVFEFVNIFYRI